MQSVAETDRVKPINFLGRNKDHQHNFLCNNRIESPQLRWCNMAHSWSTLRERYATFTRSWFRYYCCYLSNRRFWSSGPNHELFHYYGRVEQLESNWKSWGKAYCVIVSLQSHHLTTTTVKYYFGCQLAALTNEILVDPRRVPAVPLAFKAESRKPLRLLRCNRFNIETAIETQVKYEFIECY